tara:strand:- start:7143 stop:7892 length:750 start_codon:yes stop_codon:yes gene_type:complete
MTDDQKTDGPLINLSAQEETAPQEAPMAIHEPEPGEEAAKSDATPEERPDYIPAKFWGEKGADLEKLGKSYAELEKQFKSGKHKAPDEYDVNPLVDQGLDGEDPTIVVFKDWAKENGISQAAFEDLAGKVLSLSKQESESIEIDQNAEMEKLGERAQEKIQMTERLLMKAPLNNSEREAMAQGLNSADAINAFIKYHQSLTNEGIPVTPAIHAPSITKEDLETAIADPRWKTDTSFRTRIEKQWMSANN